jgi:hypothetical protein
MHPALVADAAILPNKPNGVKQSILFKTINNHST